MKVSPFRLFVATAVFALPLLAPLPLESQDFLFKRPNLMLTIWGGYAMPREASDIFQLTRDTLTVERGDFASGTWGAELAWRMNERFDIAVGLEQAEGNAPSEYENWVDEATELPIQQTSNLLRRPLTFSFKGYLLERGRSLSRYAWIPRRWSPYVGAGGGFMWYEFEQAGEWVDYETFEIFGETFRSEGMGLTSHVLAGAELSLSPRLVLRGEYRYSWAEARLEAREFVDFEPIDLSGSRAVLGLAVRM